MGSVDRDGSAVDPLTAIYVVDDLFVDSFDSRAAYPVLVMRASGLLLGSVFVCSPYGDAYVCLRGRQAAHPSSRRVMVAMSVATVRRSSFKRQLRSPLMDRG